MLPTGWQKAPWQTFLRAYNLKDSTGRYWKKKFGMVFKYGHSELTGKRCAMITRKQGAKIIEAINQVHLKG